MTIPHCGAVGKLTLRPGLPQTGLSPFRQFSNAGLELRKKQAVTAHARRKAPPTPRHFDQSGNGIRLLAGPIGAEDSIQPADMGLTDAP
jgi:hypothetical protein